MGYVSSAKENGVITISIDRPNALNALNRDIVDELDVILTESAQDPEIKCLVIRNNSNFAAGADIKAMANCDPEGAKAFAFSPVFNKLASYPIPTIAAMEGYALGGGMEMALACDLRICADNTKMGFPEITLGIMPGAGGTIRAPRAIGMTKAMELIFTGFTLDSQEALRAGLVNHVVPAEALDEAVAKMTKRIAAQSRVALMVAKKTMLDGAKVADVEHGIEIEAQNWANMFATYDQKEGMKAFMEKRKPVFENR